MHTSYLTIFTLFLFLTMSAATSSTWKNQLGSTMELNFNDDGTLNGTYTTGVGAATTSEPLVGTWLSGEESILVGFSVAWRHNKPGYPASLTSWTGVIQPAGHLKTTWILVSDLPDYDAWKNTNINQDFFKIVV